MVMTDTKAIMSWLEGLAEPDWSMFYSESEVQTIAKETLDLLKKHEAVVPIEKDEVAVITRYRFDCPCGAPLLVNQPYCACCGKEVKWK